LSWQAVQGATGYNLYWSTSSGAGTSGALISGVISPYIHYGLENGETYYYVLTSVGMGGESAASDEISATPQVGAPQAPAGFSLAAGVESIGVYWEMETGLVYNLYWSTSADISTANGTKVSGVTSPYIHADLDSGSTYYYLLTAQNAGGESPATEVLGMSPLALALALAAPTGLKATSGDGQARISWDNFQDATSYTLYWSTSPGVSPSSGYPLSGLSSPYTHTGLTNGQSYYYVVVAQNASYTSHPSTAVMARPQALPEGAPTGLTASSSRYREIDVSWDPVDGASSYNLYWSTSSSLSTTSGTQIPGASSPYVLSSGVTSGLSYYFIVTAIVDGQESFASPVTGVTAGSFPPAAPASLSATAGDASVSLSWDASATAEAYDLYFSTSPGPTTATATPIIGVSSPYSHTGLANDTTYYYIVVARNMDGPSPASSIASATPRPPAPAAPAGLTAVAGDRFISLDWTPVAGAAYYDLYFSHDAGLTTATGTKISGVFRPFIHSGLTNGQAYHYLLVAGNTGGESPASNEASATPMPPIPVAPSGSAVAGDASAVISWPDVVTAEGYDLYWSTQSGLTTSNGTRIENVTSPYTHAPLANGTAYYYILVAHNMGGSSPASAEFSCTPQAARYVLAYDPNGASGGTPPASESHVAGDPILAADNSGGLYRANYVFNGWNEAPDGNETARPVGSALTMASSNLTLYAAWIQYAEWARLASSTGDSSFDDLAAGPDGSLYAAGMITGTSAHSFGDGVSATGDNPSSNILLVKYSPAGTAQWARTQDSTDSEAYAQFNGLAVDASGNVYAVGQSHGSGSIDFGNGVSLTGIDSRYHPLIVKYDAAGNALWARSLVSCDIEEYTCTYSAVALDADGGIYAAGRLYGTGNYGFSANVTAQATAEKYAPLIVKYDADGEVLWALNSGQTSGSADLADIAVDAQGDLVACGTFVGPGTMALAQDLSISNDSIYGCGFLLRFSPEGLALDAVSAVPSQNYSSFQSLAVDGSGDIIVAGWVQEDWIYGFGNGVTVQGSARASGAEYYRNPLLVKYDADLIAQWARSTISGSSSCAFKAVGVDSAGGIYALGRSEGTGDLVYGYESTHFGSRVAISQQSGMVVSVIARYDGDGTALWAQASLGTQATSPASEFSGLAVLGPGYFCAAGKHNGSVYDFGNGVSGTASATALSASLVMFQEP
jgi:fibronectin type 3 domain-containing protein